MLKIATVHAFACSVARSSSRDARVVALWSSQDGSSAEDVGRNYLKPTLQRVRRRDMLKLNQTVEPSVVS